jgi:colanic acid biosynthesis glycosyl transferase WcaI
MRITILNQFYPPDLAPTAHLVASLAEHRAALGDDVQVVTSRGGYVANKGGPVENRYPNLRVRRMWTPGLGKSNHLFRLIDYASFYVAAALSMLCGKRQDVVIALTTPPLIGLTAMLHKWLHPRCCFVLWNMDCYPDVLEAADVVSRGGLVSRVLRWLTRLEFRYVDHLVTLDEAMSHLLLSQYVAPGRLLPTTVIPNWERVDLFPESLAEVVAEDEDEEKRDSNFVVLYLGNTGYGHRFDTVIEAACQLRGEPVTFRFVGGGKRWKELEQAQLEHGLDNMHLQGYVSKEETPRVMQQADCALITLHDWSLGIMSPSKLHSNLAMGLPVLYLGPAGSNVDEAIRRFECGESLRHGEVDKMVGFIRNCINNPAALSQLRRNARRAFDQNYCDRATLPQFDQLIDQKVAERSMATSAAKKGQDLAAPVGVRVGDEGLEPPTSTV